MQIINELMSVHIEIYQKTFKLPFRDGEESKFSIFLEETGRKAGPYLRILAMKAVREWESSCDIPSQQQETLKEEIIEIRS